MVSAYPTFDPALQFATEAEQMEELVDAIRAIRNRRAEMNVPPSKKAHLTVVTARTDTYNAQTAPFFERLASASGVEICAQCEPQENAVQIVTTYATVYIPLAEMIDLGEEKKRLEKEAEKTKGEIERLEKKLQNEGFLAKAPAAVVEAERAKLAKYQEVLTGILSALKNL